MRRTTLPTPLRPAVSIRAVWIAAGLLAALAAAEPARASALPKETTPPEVAASFERFAAEWMRETPRLSPAAPAAPAQAVGKPGPAGDALAAPAGEWSIEIRPTGDAAVPYLGLLRYVEERSACAAPTQAACAKSSTRVTEIFRFESGRWVY